MPAGLLGFVSRLTRDKQDELRHELLDSLDAFVRNFSDIGGNHPKMIEITADKMLIIALVIESHVVAIASRSIDEIMRSVQHQRLIEGSNKIHDIALLRLLFLGSFLRRLPLMIRGRLILLALCLFFILLI